MKKGKWKFSMRLISMIVLIAFTICQIPAMALSASGTTDSSVVPSVDSIVGETSEELEPTIVAEDVSKREASVKHFRLSDGSWRVVQYDIPVHFEKDSEWVEYDNTLSEISSEEEGNPDLMNAQADYEVRLKKKTNGKKWVRLEKDGYKISWYYVDGAKSTGVTTTATDDSDLTTLEKVTSIVTYADVFDGVDLRYTVSPTGLKEDFILTKPGTQTVFTAEYNIDKLTAVQTDDQTIQLRDADGAVVYTLTAPYMTDANGAISHAMTYRITETKNKRITVELTADSDWLNAADRVYPVVVDPSVQTGMNTDDSDYVETTYIADGMPTLNYSASQSLYVGNSLGEGKQRALFKMKSLPTIDKDAVIVQAQLAAYVYTSTANMSLKAHRITESWTPSSVTWETQPDLWSYVLDVQRVNTWNPTTQDEDRIVTWDITDAAWSWYKASSTHHGIMLTSDSEDGNTGCYAMLFSGMYMPPEQNEDDDIVIENKVIRPVIIIDYRDAAGLEDYWTYVGVESGRSGTTSVNMFNGNPVVTQPVTQSAGGGLLPVSFTLTYNGVSYDTQAHLSQVGNGWQTNYHLRITESDIDDDGTVDYYYYTDSDGTRHAFPNGAALYDLPDEDGLGYTLSRTGSGIEASGYALKDKAKNRMVFNADGNVISIEDEYGNSIVVSYQTVSGNKKRIKTVTDGAGRVYTLSYANSTTERVSGITDPAGRTTSFTYDADGNLTVITFPDSKTVTMTYTGDGLSTISGNDGSTVTISDSVLSRAYGDDVAERYSFGYKRGLANATDRRGRTMQYQFDRFGQTTATISHASDSGRFYQYEDRLNNPLAANKLTQASRTQSPIINLLKNPHLDTSAEYFTAIGSGASTRIHTWDSTKGHTALGSLKITRSGTPSSSGDYAFYAQQITAERSGWYTFSGYVSTDGATITDNGAQIRMERWNAAGTSYLDGKYERVSKTEAGEWQLASITMYVNAGEIVKCLVGTEGAISTGTMWFDDLQMEYGATANSNNLLQNTAFANAFVGWTKDSAAIVSDAGSPYDPENSYYAVLTGNGNTVNRVMQTVKIENGKKGDIYTLGAWGKAHSVSTNTAADAPVTATTFGLRAVFYNGTSIVGERCVSFNPHVYEWQLAAGEIIAPDDYTAINIHLEYNYNANTAYFTQPYLYRENFGVSYTYDDNGNVTSSEDLAKQESTYDYDENDQLTSTLNPTGSRFLYAYEGKTSPTTVLSTSGVRYTPTYDGKGNVVSSSVTPYSPVLTPEPGVVYYILNAKTGEAIQYFTVEGAEQSEIFTSTFADGNTSAYWTLQAAGENTYRLVSHGNTYLSVSDGLNFNEQPLVSGNTANAASAFRFVLQEDGTFGIFTTLSGETHCVESAADADYPDIQRVQLGDCDENALTSAQRWYIYETTPDSDLKILAEMTYTADGNLPATVTDALGNTTTYDYDTVKGLLDEYTDALGNKTAYTYNANNDALQSVTAGGQTVSYTYDGADRLATITTANGTVYTMVYDARGRNTQVKVGDVALSTLTYDTYDRLTKQRYANGAYITFEYDNLDRLVKKTYHSGGETQTLEYYYNSEGRLSIVIDSAENTTLRYRYDLSGRVAEEIVYTGATPETTKQRSKTAYTYDEENGQITDVADTTPMGSATQKFIYGNAQNGEMPDTVYAVESTNSLLGNKQEKLTYTYDEFGRIATRTVYIRVGTASESELKKTTTYTYMQGGHGANSTSTQIATETTDGVTKSYTYDALGNIKTVSKNGVLQESYEYDALSQLTKVTYANGDVYEYSYTVNGNITETKKNGEVVKTYSYGNTAWKDQLTAINGDSISYDEVGNPTFYYGDNQYFEWENGRRPTAVYNTNGTVTFGYAADGSRISKTVGSVTTTYYYAGGVLYGEQTGYNKLVYLYDESGTPYGFVYNDSPYYYDKNLQGDVTGIWNKNGVKIANYTYDAWGNILSITNQYGEDVTSQPRHMGNLNPLRYRGYYYDAELELYWLNTRFYDPNLGRFVNADGMVQTPDGSVLSTNMCAYCQNNPVVCVDPSGEFLEEICEEVRKAFNEMLPAYGGFAATAVASDGPLIVGDIAAAAGIITIAAVAVGVGIYEASTSSSRSPSISIPKAKDKDAVIPRPSSEEGTTYYHITTYKHAELIMQQKALWGSAWEGGYVFAWRKMPGKYAVDHSGAHLGVIISFKTNASFVLDGGITDPKVLKYQPVVSTRPGVIPVWDIKIVGVTG